MEEIILMKMPNCEHNKMLVKSNVNVSWMACVIHKIAMLC
jgi:hypothetical protein